MSRLPRRPSRVKPPLRGRAVTKQYRGEFAPVASVRRPLRAYGSRPLSPSHQKMEPPICPEPVPNPPVPIPPSPKSGLYADLFRFYKRLERLLRSMDQPWQWLLAAAIVLSGLLLLSQLK